MEIDVEKELAKYQGELTGFMRRLQELDGQRAMLVQAINERQGIIAFLTNVNHKEKVDALSEVIKE